MTIETIEIPIEHWAEERRQVLLELEKINDKLKALAKREQERGGSVPAIAKRAGVTKKTMYEWLA